MTPSWRYVLAWMGCFGLMNVYFCRINLSVAMVAMVGIDPPAGPANSSCGGWEREEEGGRVGRVHGEFSWSKPEQGMVTASYYWGYAICQVQNCISIVNNILRYTSLTKGSSSLAGDQAWLPLGFWIFYAGELFPHIFQSITSKFLSDGVLPYNCLSLGCQDIGPLSASRSDSSWLATSFTLLLV